MCWRPKLCGSVSVDLRRKRIYTRADIELSALWHVPKKRADLNLCDEVPSMDLNGVDTRGLRWLVSEEIDEGPSYIVLVQ